MKRMPPVHVLLGAAIVALLFYAMAWLLALQIPAENRDMLAGLLDTVKTGFALMVGFIWGRGQNPPPQPPAPS